MKVRSNRLYICYVTANRLEALTPALTSCCKGPGYKSPLDAMRNGPRETIVYVPCIVPPDSRQNRCNYLATVDVDPQSITYGKVGLPISVGESIIMITDNCFIKSYNFVTQVKIIHCSVQTAIVTKTCTCCRTNQNHQDPNTDARMLKLQRFNRKTHGFRTFLTLRTPHMEQSPPRHQALCYSFPSNANSRHFSF